MESSRMEEFNDVMESLQTTIRHANIGWKVSQALIKAVHDPLVETKIA